MRKALFLCVIFLLSFFTNATAQETLTQSIVKHRDFFARFNGYDDCLLSDMEVLENGKSIGVILLSPEGFEQHFVFDVQTMIPIYANARILNKNDREFLIDTSIKMSEVKKLAEAARLRAAELRKIWSIHEGKPGNIIIPVKKPISENNLNRENHNYLLTIRKEVERTNNDITAISTEEILKRFRAEVRRFSSERHVI